MLGFHDSGNVGLGRIASTAKTAVTAMLNRDTGRQILLWLENCSAAWVKRYHLVGTGRHTSAGLARPWERRCSAWTR